MPSQVDDPIDVAQQSALAIRSARSQGAAGKLLAEASPSHLPVKCGADWLDLVFGDPTVMPATSVRWQRQVPMDWAFAPSFDPTADPLPSCCFQSPAGDNP